MGHRRPACSISAGPSAERKQHDFKPSNSTWTNNSAGHFVCTKLLTHPTTTGCSRPACSISAGPSGRVQHAFKPSDSARADTSAGEAH
ncbi:hypothetical protein DUNSADRAFT_15045 [Dunaliella salina]|uniref:Encoded protein n=1 Tax=Dunaliella salina TaxID=3046 RepID=A0ABQ7G653_DUNSA|nr:hypothetical protein DUNSADRAFT_15045 [Dunaliella salina]|eukprot:KAF5830084.1 hypothetical protein DUNSADRAFT_15045 [Dunaliella salina]